MVAKKKSTNTLNYQNLYELERCKVKMLENKHRYSLKLDRKGFPYSIEQVLSDIGDFNREFDGDSIHMGSDRYLNFKHNGTVCVSCGIPGLYFRKERNYGDDKYHFNLYGSSIDGIEVLMTKDHILPKSLGGKDHLSNYQTMCTVCNGKKSNRLEFPAICVYPI